MSAACSCGVWRFLEQSSGKRKVNGNKNARKSPNVAIAASTGAMTLPVKK